MGDLPISICRGPSRDGFQEEDEAGRRLFQADRGARLRIALAEPQEPMVQCFG